MISDLDIGFFSASREYGGGWFDVVVVVVLAAVENEMGK